MKAKRNAKPSARAAAPIEVAAAPVSAPEPAASRAAIALASALAVLALARGVAALVPGMSLWGLNHTRFVTPVLGWPLWALSALALLPWLARPAAPAVVRLGDWIAGSSRAAATLAALGGAAIALALPDRVRFVGDFLLRQGTVEESGRPGVLFPQALPLDVLLHVTLPTRILDAGWLDANGAARAIGAFEAALLAVIGVALVRVLALRGAAAIAAAALLWWSGALSMFTGYSKSFVELTVLTAAAGMFALRSERTGAPPLGLGLVLGVAVALHRSALGLVPLWLAAWILWGWTHGRAGGWRRPEPWLALPVPVAALAFMLPKIVATFLKWDAIHLAPAEVKEHGGPLLAAFAGHRPMDLANLMLVLVPVLPAVLAALVALGGGLPRRREALLLLVLVLPLAGVVPFIHPAQGLFRDWDDFASAAAALSVAGAWIAGETLRAAPRFAWLGFALALGTLVPSLQWLAVQSDLDRGLARVEAIVAGPPERRGPERGNTWDYLGIRNYRLERWEASAAAFGHAAETSPSPRILLQWALAETRRGDLPAAQRIYWRIVRKNRNDVAGWSGLASVSAQLTDAPSAREAAEQMLRLRPGDRDARLLLESIEDYERKHPAPAR